MKLVLESDATRVPMWYEIYSMVLIAGAAVLIPLWLFVGIEIPSSPLRIADVPCPFCGGTRAVTSLMMGRVDLAFQYNPFAILFLVFMIFWTVSYLFVVLPFRRRLVLHTKTRWGHALMWSSVGVLVLANWAYVIWAGMWRVPLQF